MKSRPFSDVLNLKDLLCIIIIFITIFSQSVTHAQTVYTFAGSGSIGSNDGTCTAASFNYASGVALDANGNVFVADYQNHKIRKISTTGVVSTFAGSGMPGSVDGTGTSASFNFPHGIAVDAYGNVFVADRNNNKIRKITPSGVVTTLAGSGAMGSSDGNGTTASFSLPYGLAVDALGNVYIADTGNHKIRQISPGGVVTTLAGSGIGGDHDDIGTIARFHSPSGVAVDGSGNVFVVDEWNNKIRKVTPSGIVSTFAGSIIPGYSNGQGIAAAFNFPSAIAIDGSGNLYVTDTNNNKIRKITPSGFVSDFAGSGIGGSADGAASNAQFDYITGIVSNSSGEEIYIADYYHHKIRRILSCFSTVPDAPTASVTVQPTIAIPTGTIIVTAPTGGYDYSIDNINFQTSAVFSGVQPGPIQVIARSLSSLGCVSAPTFLTVSAVPYENVIGSIESGLYHTLVICDNGTVNAWGTDYFGTLGNGSNSTSLAPVQTSLLTNIIAVAATDESALALRSDGTLWAWGSNAQGQLGNGTNSNSNIPLQIPGVSGIIAIAGGKAHFLALKNDGTVLAWGRNLSGELGIGTTVNSNIPMQVVGLSQVTKLAGGSSGTHSLAIKSDGTVWAWGANYNGQLGNVAYNGPSELIPIHVSALNDVNEIIRGDNYTLVLKNDGTVYAFGGNEYGELANGTNGMSTYSGIPTQIMGLYGITAIEGSYKHAMALKSDGTVFTWGQNAYGELGNGTNNNSNFPVLVAGLSGVQQISMGSNHAHAVKYDGSAWSWGQNLGDGTNNISNVPVHVSGLCEDVLGIEDNLIEQSILIYPNPSDGIFNVTLENTQLVKGNLEVFNILGELVYAVPNTKAHMQINLSGLSRGVYVLKVYNGRNSFNEKIIFQ